MKKIFFVAVCSLLLSGCNHRIKTYYPDGKLQSEYTVDRNGKKNGLYKFYDRDGKSYREILMIHDTMSGLMKYFYAKSGKQKAITVFDRGIYNVPLTDPDFDFSISHYSFMQTYAYRESGSLEVYIYTRVIGENKTTGMAVVYENDTISSISDVPLITLRKYETDKEKRENHIEQLRVLSIPKCQRNFYILDSTDRVIDSCVGCKYIDIQMYAPNYTIKIEYIDSTFHIKHSIEEPLLKWDKRKFPDGKYRWIWTRG